MRRDRRWPWTVLALVAATTLGTHQARAQPSLTLSEQYPLRDHPVTISVTDDGRGIAGAEVTVTYRPNSQTVHEEKLATTDGAGQVRWSPVDAGIATLSAALPGATTPLASTNVAVRFGSFPGTGLFIMMVAGVLLFGGVACGFRLLLDDSRPLPGEPPST